MDTSGPSPNVVIVLCAVSAGRIKHILPEVCDVDTSTGTLPNVVTVLCAVSAGRIKHILLKFVMWIPQREHYLM